MKEEFLEYLVDPSDRMSGFQLVDVKDLVEGEVKEGTLKCRNGKTYPIIDFIPRILNDELLISLTPVSKEWLDKYRPGLNREAGKKDQQIEVARSFASEWKKFNKTSSTHTETQKAYFKLWDKSKGFRHEMVLDAGCGMGRWAMFTADKVGKLFCADISRSIEEARGMLKDKKNTFFVQADLMDLPFRENFFDGIYCLGVLHHLPDTGGAFKELAKRVRQKGSFLTYHYYSFDNRPAAYKFVFKMVDLSRRAISRQPTKVSHFISFVLAVSVYLPLISLGRLLNSAGLKKLAKNVPLYEGYHNKDFYTIYNDSVDRFTTPLEKRFSKNDITKMYRENNFSEIEVQNDVPYWVVNGVKG